MTLWLALLAWALAAQALHLRGRRRLVQVARAGHELRGPLAAAQLALDGLERSARVEAIELELQRAALALDDLTGAPRRDAIEDVNVAALLSDAAETWRALAAEHHVALAVEPGSGRVLGDRLRLAQACGNLVANAIEHGAARVLAPREPVAVGPREPVAVDPRELPLFPDFVDALFGGAELEPADPRLVHVRSSTEGSLVRIEVRDCGPGLPAPLGELVGAARGLRSVRGHGLAIAAAVAERHGGRLTSLPSARGAHLVLELPAAP